MSTSSSSPIGGRGAPHDATPPADPAPGEESTTVEPTQVPPAGAALDRLQERMPRRATTQPAVPDDAPAASTRQVPLDKLSQFGRSPSPERKFEALTAAVTPLWDLPQAQLLSDLDDLLGQARDLPRAENAALLIKIALQCGSADEETAFAVLDRVVTHGGNLPVPDHVLVLEAAAMQMAHLDADPSLAPQRLALFKRLTDQCAQMDGNAIPQLVDFLAQARPSLGQSKASDATFYTVCKLVVKLQERHRPEPLRVLAEYLLSLSEPERWRAFQAIVDTPASNGDAIVELTAKLLHMPAAVRAEAFDLAFSVTALWYPKDLADASVGLSKAIPSFTGELAQQKFDMIAVQLDQMSESDAARVALALLQQITTALPKDAAPAAFDRVARYLTHLPDDEHREDAVTALSTVAPAMPKPQADVARRLIREFQTD